MGIRGLSNFIREYNLFTKNKKLSSTPLVIDGVNLSMELYFALEKTEKSKFMFLYGGDYTIWANKVRHFFESLKKANIEPIVILDGGYTDDKLDKKKERFDNAINVCKDICSGNSAAVIDKLLDNPYQNPFVTPVLLRFVFWQVMKSMDLKHCYQVVEDHHQVMIRIAQQLNAPLMSNAGTYLAASLAAGVIKTDDFIKTIELIGDGDYVSNLSIYKITKLQEYFPRLNLSLVQVAASAILGCDDIDFKQANKVVATLNLWKKDRTSVVYNTLKWIAGFTDVNEIITEFKRRGVASDVVNFVREKSSWCVAHERVDLSVDEYFAQFHDELFLVEDNEKIPLSLQTLIVKHRLLSNLVSILEHKIDLYKPMIEDISQTDCTYKIIFPLADRILGLIRPQDMYSFEVRRYYREGVRMQMSIAQPAKELPNGQSVPGLEELKSMDAEERFALFCAMIDIDKSVVAELKRLLKQKDGLLTGDKTNLYAMLQMLYYVIFFARNFADLDNCFLHALLLNILLSGHIFVEEAPAFLNNLDKETAAKLKVNFAPYNEFSTVPFSPRIVHQYNAFQACIRTIRLASSLVLPEENVQVDGELDRYLFGLKGSFIYNLTRQLAALKDEGKDLAEYVTESFLTGKESQLAEFYKNILDFVLTCAKTVSDSGDSC